MGEPLHVTRYATTDGQFDHAPVTPDQRAGTGDGDRDAGARRRGAMDEFDKLVAWMGLRAECAGSTDRPWRRAYLILPAAGAPSRRLTLPADVVVGSFHWPHDREPTVRELCSMLPETGGAQEGGRGGE